MAEDCYPDLWERGWGQTQEESGRMLSTGGAGTRAELAGMNLGLF